MLNNEAVLGVFLVRILVSMFDRIVRHFLTITGGHVFVFEPPIRFEESLT